MSIQTHLNKQAIDMLPQIKQILWEAESFEFHQMFNRTLRVISNMVKPLIDMNSNEIDAIEFHLITQFKHNEWL